jgi:methylmalonyl-CoA mutase
VGVSSQAAGHKTLVPHLIRALADASDKPIQVICGGVIPQHDYQALYDVGVAGIFGPGTSVTTAARDVLKAIVKAADAPEAVAVGSYASGRASSKSYSAVRPTTD